MANQKSKTDATAETVADFSDMPRSKTSPQVEKPSSVQELMVNAYRNDLIFYISDIDVNLIILGI